MGLATMAAALPVWRPWSPTRRIQATIRQPFLGQLVAWLLSWLLGCGPLTPLLVAPLAWPAPAQAAAAPTPQTYLCDGDPLTALLVKGPLDEPSIPDPSNAPVPIGGSVVLRWREVNLQLPRTNNAGEASFSDGKWWWSLEDPAHPRFRLRQPLGEAREFACEAAI